MHTLILICHISIAPADCTAQTAMEVIKLTRHELLCTSGSILSGQIKVHGDQDAYYKVRCEMGEH